MRGSSLLLFATLAAAQTVAFEAASIKPAEPAEPGRNRSNQVVGGAIHWEFATLRHAIAFAYGVKDYQIAGPAWLAEDRWQIDAKAPAGASRYELAARMQTLLAERFDLRIHRETRDFNGLALVVARDGPKLKRARTSSPLRTPLTFGGPARIETEGMTMTDLARRLTDTLARPVADETELLGPYAFTLEYTAYEARRGAPIRFAGPPPPSIFDSIQSLGLRLEPRKVSLTVIVVDHAERTPAGN